MFKVKLYLDTSSHVTSYNLTDDLLTSIKESIAKLNSCANSITRPFQTKNTKRTHRAPNQKECNDATTTRKRTGRPILILWEVTASRLRWRIFSPYRIIKCLFAT